ncbi:MAG: FAD-containing oxidoreductase, partial [Gemmataceae bacterium]
AGILIDSTLRTSNPRVLAIGDVAQRVASRPVRFTHAADAMARLALRNLLVPRWWAGHFDPMLVPRCTYTDPECASIGVSTADPRAIVVDLNEVDRAVCDGANGFVKILTVPGSDRIAGATVVGPRAGELIALIGILMQHKRGLSALAGALIPDPTYTDALKKAADAFNRTRLTPWRKRLLGRVWRWQVG